MRKVTLFHFLLMVQFILTTIRADFLRYHYLNVFVFEFEFEPGCCMRFCVPSLRLFYYNLDNKLAVV